MYVFGLERHIQRQVLSHTVTAITRYNEEKTIVPIKVAPYHNPPLRLKRMLGNHIPQVRGESADVFTDAFEANMRMLLQALEDVGAAKAT